MLQHRRKFKLQQSSSVRPQFDQILQEPDSKLCHQAFFMKCHPSPNVTNSDKTLFKQIHPSTQLKWNLVQIFEYSQLQRNLHHLCRQNNSVVVMFSILVGHSLSSHDYPMEIYNVLLFGKYELDDQSKNTKFFFIIELLPCQPPSCLHRHPKLFQAHVSDRLLTFYMQIYLYIVHQGISSSCSPVYDTL